MRLQSAASIRTGSATATTTRCSPRTSTSSSPSTLPVADPPLTYRRENRDLHVRGYNEEGTITTAFDMRVQNKLDRSISSKTWSIASPAGCAGSYLKQTMQDKLIEHEQYIDRHGQDMPEIRNGNGPEQMTGRQEYSAVAERTTAA